MSPKVQAILSELREQFERLYGDRLEKLVLFGSQARGDAEEDSDIDVLVVLRGQVQPGDEIRRSGGIVADISLEHNVVVSCIHISADEFAACGSSLLLNVRREGVNV